MHRLILLAVAVGLAGCGAAASGTDTPERTATGRGVSAPLPEGWSQAATPLTELSDPREVLSVGTYPLRYRRMGCYHLPSSALADLGPDDALVTLMERGRSPGSSWADFPSRPAHFGPLPEDASEAPACVPSAHFSDHWLRFTDGERHFHVLVAFGPEAPERVRQEAWTVLDGLKIDPGAPPNWSSSP
jgi:hypothetical protein